MEITLVGTNAETSPAWVSMIGNAVREPVLPVTAPFVNFSTYSSEHAMRAPADGSGDRTRRLGKLHGLGTAQQQGNLAVSHCLLGQIVINDQRVFTRSRKNSPWCNPSRCKNCSAADSEALAATTMVLAMRRFLRACEQRWQWSIASDRLHRRRRRCRCSSG